MTIESVEAQIRQTLGLSDEAGGAAPAPSGGDEDPQRGLHLFLHFNSLLSLLFLRIFCSFASVCHANKQLRQR